jgi:hypothetical protein
MFPLTAILDIGGKILDKVFPDPAQAEQAKLKLLEMQQNGELAQLQADMNEQNNVSERWKADLASDSWLSKNIRPMSLIAIFTGYFLFAMMSAFGYEANEAYVTLLGNWGMLVFGAYFGSRSLEKVAQIKYKAEEK